MDLSELDPDRYLALSYVPGGRRAALAALWRLDVTLGRVLAGASDPMLSRIKLVWWRDALEQLDRTPAPAEPVLEAVAAHLLPAGLSGAELSQLERGWSALLVEGALSPGDLSGYAAGRGGLLFRYGARLLGADMAEVHRGGEVWALADLARNANPVDAAAALAEARALEPHGRWPSPLRPLGMLARLSRRDAERGVERLEPRGSPARMLVMARHRLTGR